jgi:hypothetical protein
MADYSDCSNFIAVPHSQVSRVVLTVFALSLCLAWHGEYAGAQSALPAGTVTSSMQPAALLPASLGKLHRASAEDASDGLRQVDAEDAAVLKEDGLKSFARSEYIDTAAKDLFGTVLVYNFGDASGAVSAYDYLRKPAMHAEKLGDEAVASSDELLVQSGVNVVVGHLQSNREGAIAMFRELIDHLPMGSGSTGIPPMLPTLLPRRGIDASSVRYALGPLGYKAMGGTLPMNLLGFDKSAEVVTARNVSGGLLTLLLYPTPQIAGEHLRMLQPALNTTGAVKIRREGTLVLLAVGDWPIGEAERTINSIHLHEEVTWNKPVPLDFHSEVKKTFTLLESIAIFCALSAVSMLVLGLFFGYGRALVRVLQGKPAATEPEFLRIDLRGALGKKLDDPGDLQR